MYPRKFMDVYPKKRLVVILTVILLIIPVLVHVIHPSIPDPQQPAVTILTFNSQ